MLLFRKHTLFCSEFENTNLFSRFEFYLHNPIDVQRHSFTGNFQFIFSLFSRTLLAQFASDSPFIVMWNFADC